MSEIAKAFAITNARISFVSLVNRAANKRKFLITKAEGGAADFQSFGRIVKADAKSHYVTGVVYEPMSEDTDGNYMTEEEITKAAHWYAKNAAQVDVQHSFEPLANASVVETWIAKADFKLNGEKIRKGTWLMTVEVTDPDVWDAIEKGDITGFSMGGVGDYSKEDVDVSSIKKADDSKTLFQKLGAALGFNMVEKSVTESYKAQVKSTAFWAAFDSLKSELHRYGYEYAGDWYETDETKIRTALQEFNDIIVELLNSGEPITKAIGKHKALNGEEAEENTTTEAVEKAAEENDNSTKEEKTDMTKEDVQKIVEEALTKVLAAKSDDEEKPTEEQEAKKPAAEEKKPDDEITADEVKKMVEAAVEKAMKPQEEQPKTITAAEIATMIDASVEKAVGAVMKSKNSPTNLNGAVEKAGNSEKHYMHGIL